MTFEVKKGVPQIRKNFTKRNTCFYVSCYLIVDQCEQDNASCYGVPTANSMDGCCHTCKDVKMEYQNMYWDLVPQNIIQCSGKFMSL